MALTTTPFYGLDSDGDDEMAMLEETFKESSVPYDEEVEVFAKYLDDCNLELGSTQEKLARVFRLVEQYSDYVAERAQALRERLRLASAARGGNASWRGVSGDNGEGGDDNDDDDDDDDVNNNNRGSASLDHAEGQNLSPVARLHLWEHEAQTWDLLRRTLPLRYGQKPSSNTKQHGPCWSDFLETTEGAAENKAVLEWLQQSARTRPAVDELVEDLQQSADRGDIVAHGWLHTKTAIKMYKTHMHMAGPVDPQTADATGSNLKTPSGGPMVTQLDPDVVARQRRKLAPQDEYFERAIWLGCFELLRRGRSMGEIRDWCQERTEAWRAVSISGLPLSLDCRTADAPVEDPTALLLWKRMCLQMARNGGTDDFERAVYGLLAGDRDRVEAVSRTWDDFVFAQYNALLRAQYDQYLIERYGLAPSSPSPSSSSSLSQFGTVELPRSGHSSKTYVDGLKVRPQTSREAKSVAKTLHASILSGGLMEFLDRQGDVLAAEARSSSSSSSNNNNNNNNNKTSEAMSRLLPPQDLVATGPGVGRYARLADHQWIRALSHVFIAISALDRVTKPEQTPDRRLPTREHILVAYISYLRLAGLDELIPLYCARLAGERRYTCMSRNLIHITDRTLQVRLLNLMSKMGHDMVAFVRIQPQLYLEDISEAMDDSPLPHTERHALRILAPGPPSLKYGRVINPGVLGNDPNDPEDTQVAEPDECLIRSMEWLLLVTGLLPETFDYGVRIYKYFLKHKRLVAARSLAERVPCADILRLKAKLAIPDEEETLAWWDDVFSPTAFEPAMDAMDEDVAEPEISREQLSIIARPFYELEAAVKVMDCLETTAQVVHQTRDDGSRDREAAKSLADNAKLIKAYMKPLLKDWLLTSQHYNREFAQLRDMYLPELVIGYASSLHAAGTSSTRDYLLECMDLAAQIAAEGSDLAELLVRTGRMKELLESFASCSKALAIWTTDLKKGQGPNSKKYRETGWSRELWTIKP